MAKTILDGRAVAGVIRDEVRAAVASFRERGISPKLSVVLVGDDPASVVYARSKERACKNSGIDYELHKFPQNASMEEVVEKISELGKTPSCHGIMVELPLPAHIKKDVVISAIDPDKDVDGLSPVNRGRMFTSREGLFPVTPQSCIEIVKRHGISWEGKNVCLIGRGDTVGKPLIFLLLNENATVTVCHTRTKDLGAHTRAADIIVAAAGRPGLLTGDMVSEGTIVVDAGINEVSGKIVGDVDYAAVSEIAGAITPVPGGVGSLTTALVQMNIIRAVRIQTATGEDAK